MTPFLRQLYNMFLDNPYNDEVYKKAIHQIEQSVCFELSDVMSLVGPTLEQLKASSIRTSADYDLMPHGGLLVMPSEYVWFEWRQHEANGNMYRVGAMLRDYEDYIACEIISSLDTSVIFKSRIMKDGDECCFVMVRTSETENNQELAEFAGIFGVMMIVFLLIINAPYGIDKDPQPVHKVWAKEAKKRGFTLKPYHYIRLSKKPPPSELAKGQGPAFHKAFHFVRGHLRRYQNGLKIMVKAHWRGDPRLGVCSMPDYKVKP